MGTVHQLKSNYQPAQKFPNAAISEFGNLLEASYVGEMLDRGFTPNDIKDFFIAAIDEACSINEYLKDISTPEIIEVVHDISTEVMIEVNGSEITYSNSICSVSYDSSAQSFDGADLTDHNNEPRFYSQNKRSHKRAASALKTGFTSTTTMYEAMQLICNNGVKCRSYCAMD
jgi:hypothetical protein